MKKNGTEYEIHVARKMRWHGYIFVKHSGKSGDFGADVIARTLLLRKIVVQCKSYSKKVGVRAVQEVIAARQYYHASKAVVATNSTFTRSARKLAETCKVELWEKY
jgi:restriction system protein